MRCCRLAILLVVFSTVVQAQEASPTPSPAAQLPPARPRIVLALEGGGALGLAHVGVLRWFEEHHIPVDGVAGTSMGALVGGFYATGMSAEEIEKFLHTIEWSTVLRGETPYEDRSLRRKEDRRDYPNSLEFGLKHGVSFPGGFNTGHQVGLILDRVAFPYAGLKSFDDLPTPFRCVATDLVTGKATVFDQGSLATALQASMSLPALFSPVRRDGQIYVDGGLIENLPVDVARSMGAGVVIGVHLKTKVFIAAESPSVFDVLDRSISLIIALNELRSMEKADVLISANTEDFTTLEYQREDKIVEAGYQAAAARSEVLLRFVLDDAAWKQYVDERQARRRPDPVPEFVDVTGTGQVIAKGLRKNLQDNVGSPLDFDRLDNDLTDITGLGRFARAGFQLTWKDGKPGLLVRADEKLYAPPTVNPVLIIDGSDYTDVRFSLGARITLLDVGGFGSEVRTDVIAGAQYGIRTEYYHPLRWASHFFVAPQAFATSVPFDIYQNEKRIATYRERNLGGGLDFGIAIDRFSELRFGYEVDHVHLGRQIGSPELANVAGRQGISRLLYVFDHTDDPTIPREGVRVQSRFEFYDANPGATEHFPLAEVRAGFFQRVSKPSSIFLQMSGGSTLGYDRTGLPPFSLGGPNRLSAYGYNEFLTNQYFLFQPGYIHRLTELSPLLGKNVYLIAQYEIGKAYNPFNASSGARLPNDGSVSLLVQSFIGPIVFGGSIGDSGHRKFFFQVGRLF